MRVHIDRLLALIDPESTLHRRLSTTSTVNSARSTSSGYGPALLGSRGGRGAQMQGGSDVSRCGKVSEPTRLSTPGSAKTPVAEEPTVFELLHTERGFAFFNQWYRRLLASGGQTTIATPQPCLGALWSQAFCPQLALHDFAFAEFLRTFVECSDSEAFDLFDLLDDKFLGMLGLEQIYLAICLVAALGSRQLTKFLYFHSTRLFSLLEKGSVGSAQIGCVALPRLVTLLRLLGAPTHLILRTSAESGLDMTAQLRYDGFLEVVFPIVEVLDRGFVFGESAVINEHDQLMNARSRTCTIN